MKRNDNARGDLNSNQNIKLKLWIKETNHKTIKTEIEPEMVKYFHNMG